jgi:hypothetical protein
MIRIPCPKIFPKESEATRRELKSNGGNIEKLPDQSNGLFQSSDRPRTAMETAIYGEDDRREITYYVLTGTSALMVPRS